MIGVGEYIISTDYESNGVIPNALSQLFELLSEPPPFIFKVNRCRSELNDGSEGAGEDVGRLLDEAVDGFVVCFEEIHQVPVTCTNSVLFLFSRGCMPCPHRCGRTRYRVVLSEVIEFARQIAQLRQVVVGRKSNSGDVEVGFY